MSLANSAVCNSSSASIPSMSNSHDIRSVPTPAGFQVGVDAVIFAVDMSASRLLVLLGAASHQFVETATAASDAPNWHLPGTLVGASESPESAARSLLWKTTQTKNLYLEQLYTFGEPNRHSPQAGQGHGARYLSVSYLALLGGNQPQALTPVNQDCQLAWHIFSEVPTLTFDQNKIINYGYARLRNKLEYSPIAFQILPESFTLSYLYQFYTIVLGENFSDYSNFRSRLLKLGFLQDTGLKTSRGAGRPATLYRFDRAAFAPYKDKPLVFV